MAVDKLVDSTQLNADLTSVANAIRTKGGTSAQLAFPAGFVSAVEAIPTGGGGHARQAFYQKFYPAETYAQTNKLSLELEPSDNCFILVRAVNYPTPDSTQYKALLWGLNRAYFNSTYTNSGTIHSILRPNGTIGTDATQCSFNASTGILLLGGEYGHFLPDDEYEVIQVVFE